MHTDDVASHEVALRLKQAGYPQDQGILYWVKDRIGVCLYQSTNDKNVFMKLCRIGVMCKAKEVDCLAPSPGELWGKLPSGIKRNGRPMVLTVSYNSRGHIIAAYIETNRCFMTGDELSGVGKTLADALAELWLALDELRKKKAKEAESEQIRRDDEQVPQQESRTGRDCVRLKERSRGI